MGTPLPPNEPRTACSECFGANPILGPTQPRWITCTFSDVIRGPGDSPEISSWPSGPWLLEHTVDCAYRMVYPTHIIQVNWSPSNTLVRWTDASSVFLFNAAFNELHCAVHVPSQIVYGWNIIAYGGICDITWSLAGL
jgi:hypothetical protein